MRASLACGGKRGARLDDGVRRAADQERAAVTARNRPSSSALRSRPDGAQRVLEAALASNHDAARGAAREARPRPAEPLARELAHHGVERQEPVAALVGRDEQSPPPERVDRSARLDDPERLAQLGREVLEGRDRRDHAAHRRRLPVEHLLGQIVEQRPLRTVQAPPARRRGRLPAPARACGRRAARPRASRRSAR